MGDKSTVPCWSAIRTTSARCKHCENLRNDHNQIRLPETARKALEVVPGDSIRVVVDGKCVHLLPEPANWSDYIYGLGKTLWDGLGGGEKFLREERAAW